MIPDLQLGTLKDFESFYAYPIKQAQKRSSSSKPQVIIRFFSLLLLPVCFCSSGDVTCVQVVNLGRERAQRLTNLINNYHLRRTKEEMLEDLSKLGKDDIVVWCDLTPLQVRKSLVLLA